MQKLLSLSLSYMFGVSEAWSIHGQNSGFTCWTAFTNLR